MNRTLVNNLHLWQFGNLARENAIDHFVTDRSSLNGPEFTMSLSSTPDRDLVTSNRKYVAEAMNVPEDRLYLPSQVHGTRIVNVDSDIKREMLMETDALICNQTGICIAVMSADCVPILLLDKDNGAVAAVHSGWRGTVARIVERTLYEMQGLFGTKGENIVAGIGPSVSQEYYDVGEEVIEAVGRSFDKKDPLLVRQANGKARLDLWMANKIQLTEFGVPAGQIEISNLCTVKHNNYFFSARKGDRGRFAAGIVLR